MTDTLPSKEEFLERAKGEAIGQFDEWNDVTGCYPKGTGYYAEITSVIEDAVQLGWHARSIAERPAPETPERLSSAERLLRLAWGVCVNEDRKELAMQIQTWLDSPEETPSRNFMACDPRCSAYPSNCMCANMERAEKTECNCFASQTCPVHGDRYVLVEEKASCKHTLNQNTTLTRTGERIWCHVCKETWLDLAAGNGKGSR